MAMTDKRKVSVHAVNVVPEQGHLLVENKTFYIHFLKFFNFFNKVHIVSYIFRKIIIAIFTWICKKSSREIFAWYLK